MKLDEIYTLFSAASIRGSYNHDISFSKQIDSIFLNKNITSVCELVKSAGKNILQRISRWFN